MTVPETLPLSHVTIEFESPDSVSNIIKIANVKSSQLFVAANILQLTAESYYLEEVAERSRAAREREIIVARSFDPARN